MVCYRSLKATKLRKSTSYQMQDGRPTPNFQLLNLALFNLAYIWYVDVLWPKDWRPPTMDDITLAIFLLNFQ